MLENARRLAKERQERLNELSEELLFVLTQIEDCDMWYIYISEYGNVAHDFNESVKANINGDGVDFDEFPLIEIYENIDNLETATVASDNFSNPIEFIEELESIFDIDVDEDEFHIGYKN